MGAAKNSVTLPKMTVPFDTEQLRGLLVLAQDKRPDARAHLAVRMGDMILGTDLGSMSARERELAEEILQRLLHELEMPIRRALAERLAAEGVAPRRLIVQLANDRIEVAWPVLLKSELLDDDELLNVIRTRTFQHRLAIARRDRISAPVSDALVRPGEQDVVRAVLENPGATITTDTFETLVEHSQSDSDLQEMILKREDLDPKLAGRMYGWVSEALRRHIIENFEIDHYLLDKAIGDALADVVADHARVAALNGALVRIRGRRWTVTTSTTSICCSRWSVRASARCSRRCSRNSHACRSRPRGAASTSRAGAHSPWRARAAMSTRRCSPNSSSRCASLAIRPAGWSIPGELFDALSFYDLVEDDVAVKRKVSRPGGAARRAAP